MGITGELVRSVFSKSRSIGTHDTPNVRSSPGERKRWSAVRSYLCGDEINSVLAEEDSASWRSTKDTAGRQLDFSSVYADEESGSVRGSEATVTQPTVEDLMENEEIESKEKKEEALEEKQNSTSKLFVKDDAAVVIQSAFRSFLARRQNEKRELMNEEALNVGNGSPSRESIGTSIEVQTANSVSHYEEVSFYPHRNQSKGSKAQVWRLKEDWDDSTVSSNISKRRIQNRLEATTRRERALAYAFSQQLRICSRKKQSRSNDGTEPNAGWNWLERWMATRQQDGALGDISKQIEQLNGNQKLTVKRKLLVDLAGELEKESCGSNEVSLQLDSVPLSAPSGKDYYKPARNRLKATNLSKRKTVPTYNYLKENPKVIKKDLVREDEKEKLDGAKEAGVCEDAASQVSPETETSKNSQ